LCDVLLESPEVGLLGFHIFELRSVGLPEFRKHLPDRERAELFEKGERNQRKMPRAREEDMREDIPIPMKPLMPSIPTDDEELRELREDLRRMGCEGLLGQPWNV
jgi:hypothetical protein